MSGSSALIAAVLLPMAGALGVVAAGRHPNVREGVTLVTAVLLAAIVLSLWPEVSAGGRPAAVLIETMPGLALAFELEPLGMLFAFVASSLWIVTSVYAIGYMRGHGEEHQTRFYACFAIALGGAMGVAFAANMFTLFVFYEVLTLSTVPLVTHSGTQEARRAGRTYLGILLGTSIGLQLVAIAATWVLAGTLDFEPGGILAGKAPDWVLAVLFAVFIFGIGKAALMPFHRWLPAAMVAPTPVSALLHAVAVVKAGVCTVVKVSVDVFGIDWLAASGAGLWIAYVAGATILIASLVAMRQDNLKRRLAYSTISQLSYIVLGAMLASAWGVIGSGMHIAMHAFGKITLFFCAGAIMVATHRTRVSELGGLGRQMPITMAAFALGALSIIGAPPLGGLWSKWFLAYGTVDSGQYVLLGVLLISSLLNVLYLLPIPIRAFFGRRADDGIGSAVAEAPWPCVLALGFTAIGSLVLFFMPEPLYALMAQIVGRP
ncbi:MAG: monovalent cation/H+ antiporter subunit D family protein [Gammaproteobacteria bacterium]